MYIFNFSLLIKLLRKYYYIILIIYKIYNLKLNFILLKLFNNTFYLFLLRNEN